MNLDEHGNTRACPICDADAQQLLPDYNSYEMSACPSCGFVYTKARRFPDMQYEDVYANETVYRMMVEDAVRTARGELGARDLWWFKRVALRWLRRQGTGGRLVEIGSGPGTFLLVARQQGWTVTGIEPTSLAAKKAQELGIETFCGTAEQYVQNHDERFDVVTAFEVLEHVPDVTAATRAIHELVAPPGGLFIFSVPNLDDPYMLRQRYPVSMPPIHINFFNRQSITRALTDAGFEVVRFMTMPIPTSTVRNLFGKRGLLLRLPMLAVLRLMGRADGTTLLGMARRAT